MKKSNKFITSAIFYLLMAAGILCDTSVFAQVGINNANPNATFEVAAKNTNGSTPEGIIAPKLTGDQIKAGDALYNAAQTGSIVYATDTVGTVSAKTVNITAPGYYYFDGTVWQKLGNTSPTGTFIPSVVAAGQATSTITQPPMAAGTFTRWNFVTSTNDGNWNTANNTYTIPKTGFYQFSLAGLVSPSTNNNSFVWRMRYGTGNDFFEFEIFSGALPGYQYNKGGTIVLYMNAGTVVEFGGHICGGCNSTYTVTTRSFAITFLGT